MLLYKVKSGVVVAHEGAFFLLDATWDTLINHEPLYEHLEGLINTVPNDKTAEDVIKNQLLAPIGSQEVWAAGVTYLRSREARMEESKPSGGASCYDLVYDAERPELFFKSTASRVAGHGETVHIRRDSTWSVPEPELTLVISRSGRIQGYTIGNDMSSRSIEGENPLYLPQAKTYERSAAIGPCIYVPPAPISPETKINLEIIRAGKTLYADAVAISKMKRSHTELVGYLFRECDFPAGCYLMTGTCLVPPGDFTLAIGDVVTIQIDSIGTLTNTVGIKH